MPDCVKFFIYLVFLKIIMARGYNDKCTLCMSIKSDQYSTVTVCENSNLKSILFNLICLNKLMFLVHVNYD